MHAWHCLPLSTVYCKLPRRRARTPDIHLMIQLMMLLIVIFVLVRQILFCFSSTCFLLLFLLRSFICFVALAVFVVLLRHMCCQALLAVSISPALSSSVSFSLPVIRFYCGFGNEFVDLILFFDSVCAVTWVTLPFLTSLSFRLLLNV